MTVALPAPFDTAAAQGSMSHGHRSISLTLTTPGELFRNTYNFAWVDITELASFRGEPLRLTTYRRRGTGYMRESFTPTARERITALLLPPVVRYGFNRWWMELNRARYDIDICSERADHARAVAEWWERCADLVAMHQAGDLELVAIEHTQFTRHPSALVADPSDGRTRRVDLAAAAHCRGEHVGWMTREANLIPTGDLLGRVR